MPEKIISEVRAMTIPKKTAEKLSEAPVKGQRHKHAMDLALPLLGSGLSPAAVFSELRGKFDSDVTDKELQDIISWAVTRATPNQPTPNFQRQQFVPKIVEPPRRSPVEQAAWWLSGQEMTEEAFTELSPTAIPKSSVAQMEAMFELIYAATENINIICDYTLNKDGKANPQGSGKTMLRDEWSKWIRTKGVPQSKAGAWIRPNPVTPQGSGKSGAITDADVSSHRFVLLESDSLPLTQQYALFSKLNIPISVVVCSGGKSVHAWARIDAIDDAHYREITKRILLALEPFGIDQSNKNPSRLSRLAGAKRGIGAIGDGSQKLLWLNPKVSSLTVEKIAAFEESLLLPAVQEKPMRELAKAAVNRYEDLIANRGKLGVQTGIADFDRDSGGLKKGNFIVIAAETGGGKSTLGFNIINNAVQASVGVALFTLEMDNEEVTDALVAMNCKVDRNAFNTGFFQDAELSKIANVLGKIANMPLWIYDSPLMTVVDVRRAVMQLRQENKIGLALVDYVQLLSSSEFPNNREQQIASISRSLRSLAKEAKIPIIGLSQLNDEGKLRESRVLAHEAHIVFMLDELETRPRLRVVKGRRIRKATYDLFFDSKYGLLKSLDKINHSDIPPNPKPNYDHD